MLCQSKTHFSFHTQIFRTGQVLGTQGKRKEDGPPVDAGWWPWGILRWHLCICRPTTQQGWGLLARCAASWCPPAAAVFSINARLRDCCCACTLPVKPPDTTWKCTASLCAEDQQEHELPINMHKNSWQQVIPRTFFFGCCANDRLLKWPHKPKSNI